LISLIPLTHAPETGASFWRRFLERVSGVLGRHSGHNYMRPFFVMKSKKIGDILRCIGERSDRRTDEYDTGPSRLFSGWIEKMPLQPKYSRGTARRLALSANFPYI